MMKLWLLRPVFYGATEKPYPMKGTAFDPWYDKAFGFVVRAMTEQAARKKCLEKCGDEKEDAKKLKLMNPWLDPKQTTCVELTPEGEAGIIMRDFASA